MSEAAAPSGERADTRPRERIYDARESMHEARIALKTEQMAGGISHDTRHKFCGVLSAYYDCLKEHRDDPALDPAWEDRSVDWIDEWSTQKITQKRTPNGTHYGTSVDRVNKLLAAPVEKLLEGADALDLIARDLGFAAETTDHTPKDEWDMMDLVHLMTVRGQEQPAQEVYDALDIETGKGGDDGHNPDSADATPADADD